MKRKKRNETERELQETKQSMELRNLCSVQHFQKRFGKKQSLSSVITR